MLPTVQQLKAVSVRRLIGVHGGEARHALTFLAADEEDNSAATLAEGDDDAALLAFVLAAAAVNRKRPVSGRL